MKKTIKGLCVILSFFMLLSSIPLTDNLLFLSEAMVYYVPPGDVDNDGYATAEDARYIFRASVDLEDPDETQKYHSDVDKDGNITAADARLAIRASVKLEDIDIPSAFDVPQVSGTASGKISLSMTETTDNRFKIYAVAKNYADLKAGNWKLSYDENKYSLKSIKIGSNNKVDKDVILELLLNVDILSSFNYNALPGEALIGLSFKESLGVSEETILFTAEFEIKADSSSDTEIVLYTADGRTEASLDMSRLPGDTDNDMLATAEDARYIFRASVDLEAPDETQKYYSDVDQNGNITAADARLTLRASVGIEDIGLPSAFDVPQISGEASGKIRLRMSEITDNSFRVYAVAKNYAELEAANWKLSYDKNKYSIKKIGRGSDPYKDDEGVINKLAADLGLLTEFVYYVNPGECLIGYAFRDSLGVADEVILFTAEFEIKDDYSSGTKIELCTANGLTEALLYTDQHLGDTDKDSYVTAYDARFILRASIELETPDEEQKYYSDVDKNGKITAADARLTLRASVKLEDIGLPCAYEQPQISGAASEKLKLRISESIDNTIKVYAVAENYADLEAANWKLTYDKNNYSLRSLYTGSKRNDYDNSIINRLIYEGKLAACSNDNAAPGEALIALAFTESLGAANEVILFTAELEIKDYNDISKKEITLSLANGITEDTAVLIINGHETHSYKTKTITKKPTCKEDGIYTVLCECGQSYTEKIPAAHTFGEWKIIIKSGIHTDGLKERVCSVCKATETKIIPGVTCVIPPENDNMTVYITEDTVFAPCESKINDIIDMSVSGLSVTDKDGKKVSEEAELASGMTISVKDENGSVIDTKTIVIPGDNTGDGAITAADARVALRASVNLDKLNSWQQPASNVVDTKTDKVTAADARFILRASVKLESFADWIKELK